MYDRARRRDETEGLAHHRRGVLPDRGRVGGDRHCPRAIPRRTRIGGRPGVDARAVARKGVFPDLKEGQPARWRVQFSSRRDLAAVRQRSIRDGPGVDRDADRRPNSSTIDWPGRSGHASSRQRHRHCWHRGTTLGPSAPAAPPWLAGRPNRPDSQPPIPARDRLPNWCSPRVRLSSVLACDRPGVQAERVQDGVWPRMPGVGPARRQTADQQQA